MSNKASKTDLIEMIDPSAMFIVERAINLVLEGVYKPEAQISSEFGIPLSKVKRLLELPEVKSYLAYQVENLLKEAYLDKIAVIEEIKKIAFSNISDFGNLEGNKMHWLDWHQLDKNLLACVESVKSTKDKFGDEMVEVKLYSKEKALAILTKMYEMVVDKSEVKHTKENEKPSFFEIIETTAVEAKFEEKEDGAKEDWAEREAVSVHQCPEEQEI